MSIPIGVTIDEGVYILPTMVTSPVSGRSGARSGGLVAKDARDNTLEANELAGRIGPIVGAYDPEGTDRMIQEF